MKYIAFLYIYEGDSDYTAVVPDLQGCLSSGETYEQACDMIQDAAELWLKDEKFPKSHPYSYFTDDVRKSLDIPLDALTHIVDVKQDRNVRVNIMMSSKLLEAADKRADSDYNGNRSAYLQSLVFEDLRIHHLVS